MPDELKPYDDLEKLVSPESIQIMGDALKKMHESLANLGKAINEALVDQNNKNHEIVTLLVAIGNRRRQERETEFEKMNTEYHYMSLGEFSKEVDKIGRNEKKLPKKLRNGWK